MINRSIVLPVLLLIALLIPAIGYADEAAETYERIRPFFDRMFHPTALSGQTTLDDTLPPLKCATPLILQAMALPEQYRQALGIEAAGKRPFDSLLTKTFESPAGHFLIHYTDSPGANQINMSYGDQNGNSVPDYAEIVARVADSVWVHHIDTLGYHEPLSDGAYPWGDGSRYDIFLGFLDAAYYGATWEDTIVADGDNYRGTSWMQLQNHYERYNKYRNRPIEALQVTIAHEFFHAIQMWYDGTEHCADPTCRESLQNPYWMEMSAVWMEEETYDDVNDYYEYLPYYFPFVHRSLRTSEAAMGYYPYGAGVFPIYLAERFGKSIIREAWKHCGDAPIGNFLESAIKDALADVTGGSVDFEHAWVEYARWLYFTGARARPGQFFEEADTFPMIPATADCNGQMKPYIRTYSEYPILSNQTGDYCSFYPSDFGFNYLDFKTSSLYTVLTFVFNGASGPGIRWRLGVMAFDKDNPSTPVWVKNELDTNKATIKVKNFNAYTDIVVMPTLMDPALQWTNNAYRFSVNDTSIVINGNRIVYGPSRILLSDPDEANQSLLVTFLAIEDAAVKMKVYTPAGEEIFSAKSHVIKNDKALLKWYGKNAHGEQVASGVYVVHVGIGNDDKTFKVLVIR